MLEQKRFLPNGEVIVKTEEGIYFHSLSETSMPILIDKEDIEGTINELGDEVG